MKKTYQEPNAELVSLVPQDRITNDWVDGEMELEKSLGDLFG